MPTSRAVRVGSVAIGAVLLLTACTTRDSGNGSESSPASSAASSAAQSPPAPASSSTSAAPSTPPPSTASSPPPPDAAHTLLASMTEAQRVGQLFMVDCPSSGVAPATTSAIVNYDVGSVILDGNSQLSVAQTAAITGQLQASAPKGVGLFISTDQEGGEVLRMRGPGFSAIPSALVQGTVAPGQLRTQAAQWGGQLRAAGINLDLAPVLDTVPAGFGSNPPIGDFDREYGHTPSVVASHGVAVAQGLADAGVDATAKHFPGLGRVRANTDTTAGVTDSVTTRTDAYLAPYAAAVQAGVPFVMMSSAVYTLIDPTQPAAFSPTVVTGLLRTQLGFKGVVISDDLGAAVQVAAFAPGARAVDFVAAGGDIVLTVTAQVIPAMVSAVMARAAGDPAFAQQVDAAALRVLEAKQARGLL
jgi:beta-N-acetylhexosaminidase